jgi:hypothetical protein
VLNYRRGRSLLARKAVEGAGAACGSSGMIAGKVTIVNKLAHAGRLAPRQLRLRLCVGVRIVWVPRINAKSIMGACSRWPPGAELVIEVEARTSSRRSDGADRGRFGEDE